MTGEEQFWVTRHGAMTAIDALRDAEARFWAWAGPRYASLEIKGRHTEHGVLDDGRDGWAVYLLWSMKQEAT